MLENLRIYEVHIHLDYNYLLGMLLLNNLHSVLHHMFLILLNYIYSMYHNHYY